MTKGGDLGGTRRWLHRGESFKEVYNIKEMLWHI